MPNNRQWAVLIWLAVIVALGLSRAETRHSIQRVVHIATRPRLFGWIGLLVAWVTALAWAGSKAGLWGPGRFTDTVFWFVSTALALFLNLERVSKDRHYLRQATVAAVKVSALISVLYELSVLSLWAEIALVPILAMLGGLSVVAGQRTEHRRVKRLVDHVILLFSLALFTWVCAGIAGGWSQLDKVDAFQQFALPVWMTLGVLPLIYVVGLVAAYESAFLRLAWTAPGGWLQRLRPRLVLVSSFGLKAWEVASFSGSWQRRLADAISFTEGRDVVKEFRRARAAEARAEDERLKRLVRFANVDGDDEYGRRLDRREFDETIAALRWISTCQMGWHHNPSWGRYRPDLLEFVLAGDSHQLPEPHGVELRVSPDGRAYYAWRRTVSGWVFAIGAAGPPPDEWTYDGPAPPQGFPGEDPAWGSEPFSDEAGPNW